jgi:hypothetical protein
MGIPAIQGPLANPSSKGNLVHADRLNTSFGKEAPRYR